MGIPWATVCRILQRNGLSRLSALEIKPPPQRYQHENPGDLLHLDIKKLGRFERPGDRVTGDRKQAFPAPVGSMAMGPWTTPPGLALRGRATR